MGLGLCSRACGCRAAARRGAARKGQDVLCALVPACLGSELSAVTELSDGWAVLAVVPAVGLRGIQTPKPVGVLLTY
jgi:hypothetical protein